MAMTEQVRYTVSCMLRAGFRRRSFRVRAQRVYSAGLRKEGAAQPYYYGPAQITVFGQFCGGQRLSGQSLIAHHMDNLVKAGLGVHRFRLANGKFLYHISTRHSEAGMLVDHDLTEQTTEGA